MQQTKVTEEALFPISVVSEMTGIKAITLRAWERRYGAIIPTRTDSGRRLYTSQDVEKIMGIKQLLDQGFSISRALRATQEQDYPISEKQNPVDDLWQFYLSEIKTAIAQFNEHKLDDAYHEVTGLYPIDMVTTKLLIPLMHSLGEKWESREGSVAEEHFFSTYLRNKLGARFHHQNRLLQGSPIIVAGLPGDLHEFGLLLLSLSLLNQGCRVLNLGTNLPIDALQHTLAKVDPVAIVLTGSHEIELEALSIHLRKLKESTRMPVFLGGRVGRRYAQELSELGLIVVDGDLTEGVQLIMQTLSESN